MNYGKIYEQIITRAKNRILSSYKEKHHIIPKCLGGTNKKENIVELTAREHFICHLLLTKIYNDNNKLNYALWAMVNQNNPKQKRIYKISSRLYESLRREHSNRVSLSNKLRTISEKTKEKISKANKGKKRSEETKNKMSINRTGKKRENYKPKEKKFSHICDICNVEYKSADIKGRFCEECKKPKECKCGCKKLVKTPGKFYYPNCEKRGKTYLEIYKNKKNENNTDYNKEG